MKKCKCCGQEITEKTILEIPVKILEWGEIAMYYWSSTEYSATYANAVDFGNGGATTNGKSTSYSVRSVKTTK